MSFIPGVFEQQKNGPWDLRKPERHRGKSMASIPFETSDFCTEGVLNYLYTLKEDWELEHDKNGRRLPEDFNTKEERYQGYAKLIASLRGTTFYLEPEYYGSGRMGYLLQLEGIRPHGKPWELHMIDSATAYYLDEDAQNALKHVIYVTLHGRVCVDEAVAKWDDKFLGPIKEMDIFKAKDLDEANDILLLQKAAKSLELAWAGKPTKYMFQWDFTSSGLIIAGLSFHSRPMMDVGNIHSGDKVADVYVDSAKSLGFSELLRKKIKLILMPYFHGSTYQRLVMSIKELTGKSLKLKTVKAKMEKAFGPCIANILDITNWGVGIVHNEQTEFYFTLPDLFRATHRAYFKSIEVRVTVASANPLHEETCKTTHTFTLDMPVNRQSDGQWLVKTKFGPKVRGLFANITHGIDAFVLRCIVDVLLSLGMPFLLKHDAYTIHPSCYRIVLEEARKAFGKLFETNLYAAAIKEIAGYAKSKPPVLHLVHGKARETIVKAKAFFMP
jgi:hypothetical protein